MRFPIENGTADLRLFQRTLGLRIGACVLAAAGAENARCARDCQIGPRLPESRSCAQLITRASSSIGLMLSAGHGFTPSGRVRPAFDPRKRVIFSRHDIATRTQVENGLRASGAMERQQIIGVNGRNLIVVRALTTYKVAKHPGA
jgi:hypothetical protein